MKAISNLSDATLRKRIYSLRKELRSDIEAIQTHINEGVWLPTYAIDKFASVSEKMPQKSVYSMDRKELLSTFRALQYVRGLKASTVKGAYESMESIEPIKSMVKGLSPKMQNKFWRIYGRIYDESGGLAERFKYELIQSASEYVFGGGKMQDEELDYFIEQIMREYRRSVMGEELPYEKGEPKPTDTSLSFSERLQFLLNQLR